jgi:arginyl-tRNA synthetase
MEQALKKCAYQQITNYRLSIPSNPEFGILASSICFELAHQQKQKPSILAEQIVAKISLPENQLIARVEARHGYINFYANYSQFSKLTLMSVQLSKAGYGYVQTQKPQNIIVEHTSVNPSGPIHIGTARNSILGDALYRMLRARGHHVRAHFYVNDVGKQIAVLVYGYQITQNTVNEDKIDHWLGRVYAITSCLIEIKTLSNQLSSLQQTSTTSEIIQGIETKLADWETALNELKKQDPTLVNELSEKLMQTPNIEEVISQLLKKYEAADTRTQENVKKVVNLCLSGFKQTYDRINIKWDSWDWESDLVRNGAVTQVIHSLGQTPYCSEIDGALVFDGNHVAEDMNLKQLFNIPLEHDIPSLTLTRSDGTSLYSTRDIAYSIWKINQADRVLNVIGKEQALAQTQIKIAISLISSLEKALNQVHYAYELVQILGYKMSKRRGRYITLDEILDEAEKRAHKEVESKSPHLADVRKSDIAKVVGIGAVKYALISIAPSKPVMFSWERALNFDTNSAPFIQYAYARATNILKKATKTSSPSVNYSLFTTQIEKNLINKIACFPEVFIEATQGLSPHTIAEFANDLAASFNSFYASTPVLQAETEELQHSRLELVKSVRITLKNALSLLGIDVLERM